uniref:Reverse ribonuclease n=1 Tax=Triatoma infestans TaxID=30076 RepID=A0A161N018_TRIIF
MAVAWTVRKFRPYLEGTDSLLLLTIVASAGCETSVYPRGVWLDGH